MSVKTIALLHPGNMGVTIGAAAATSGARVVWASRERSKATQERAKQAGLVDVGNLADALRESARAEVAFLMSAASSALPCLIA